MNVTGDGRVEILVLSLSGQRAQTLKNRRRLATRGQQSLTVETHPAQQTTVVKMRALGPPETSFGEGDDTPLQYSSLEKPMDGGAW